MHSVSQIDLKQHNKWKIGFRNIISFMVEKIVKAGNYKSGDAQPRSSRDGLTRIQLGSDELDSYEKSDSLCGRDELGLQETLSSITVWTWYVRYNGDLLEIPRSGKILDPFICIE